MKHLLIYFLLCASLLAQATKVGGSGVTKVGGSGVTKVAGAGSVGPNTWYTSGAAHNASRDASADTAWTSAVVVAQAGTATKLKIYVGVFSSTVNVAMGLYDSDSVTLLGIITPVASSATGYLEGTLTSPVSVTAQTYYVGWISSAGTTNTQFAIDSSSSSAADVGQAYPTMPSPFVNVFTNQALCDVGIFVQ